MSEQIVHIKVPISRDDLDTVVAGMEAACGGDHILVTETFELVVQDKRQAAALEALFPSKGTIEEATIKPRKGKQEKIPAEKPKRKSPKYIPYTFLSGPRINDTISGGALGEILKAGNLAAGVRLSHPVRGELVVVTNREGRFTLQAVPA
jgi:hypothetical protein